MFDGMQRRFAETVLQRQEKRRDHPAMVAWTPDFSTKTHKITATRTKGATRCTPRAFMIAKAAKGNSASTRYSTCNPWP